MTDIDFEKFSLGDKITIESIGHQAENDKIKIGDVGKLVHIWPDDDPNDTIFILYNPEWENEVWHLDGHEFYGCLLYTWECDLSGYLLDGEFEF